MSALKPCPFCGRKAKLIKTGKSWWTCCIGCGARTYGGLYPTDSAKESAIEAWNRRAE
ncbi:MAG: Lar family restriction alleviation protein [Oscillospiraceae bacterium]|nr:Lar family restriction alleviation protein [Oscillospiraceae bacterium]